MIEDEKIGLKIAENEDEKFYMGIEKDCNLNIENLKKQLRFNEDILEMAKAKLVDIREQMAQVRKETIEDGS